MLIMRNTKASQQMMMMIKKSSKRREDYQLNGVRKSKPLREELLGDARVFFEHHSRHLRKLQQIGVQRCHIPRYFHIHPSHQVKISREAPTTPPNGEDRARKVRSKTTSHQTQTTKPIKNSPQFYKFKTFLDFDLTTAVGATTQDHRTTPTFGSGSSETLYFELEENEEARIFSSTERSPPCFGSSFES